MELCLLPFLYLPQSLYLMVTHLLILRYCCVMCFLVLDPALVGLSIAYSVSLSNILQYSVRLSAEAENLVSWWSVITDNYGRY